MRFATFKRCLRGLNPPRNASADYATITTSVATVLADGAATVTLTFGVFDGINNPVAGATVLPTPQANCTFSTPAVTSAQGTTTCTLSMTTATLKTVAWKANGIPMSATVDVTGTASQTASATHTTIASDASSVQVGSLAHITVQAKTSAPANKTVGGDTVTLSNSGGTTTGTMSAVTDVGDGTYTATFTVTADGTATTITGTINGVTISGGTLPTVTGTAATTYFTPDLVNNATFGSGDWSGAVNWSGGTPPASGGQGGTVSLATDQAYDGTYSVKRLLPVMTGASGDDSPQFGFQLATHNVGPFFNAHWSRFYFRFSGVPTSAILKLHLDFDDGLNTDFWGLYIHSGSLRWFFPEDAYLNHSQVSSVLASAAAVCDGNWHSIEIYHRRNGDTGYDGVDRPSVKIWLDDFTTALSPADTDVTSGAYRTRHILSGGTIYAVATGLPYHSGTRIYPNTTKLGYWGAHGVLNANSNTSAQSCWIDKVAVSTLGRIGP